MGTDGGEGLGVELRDECHEGGVGCREVAARVAERGGERPCEGGERGEDGGERGEKGRRGGGGGGGGE